MPFDFSLKEVRFFPSHNSTNCSKPIPSDFSSVSVSLCNSSERSSPRRFTVRALVRTHSTNLPNKNFKFNKRPAILYHPFSVPGGSEVSLCLNGQIFDLPPASPHPGPHLSDPRPPATRLFSTASTLLKLTLLQPIHSQSFAHSLQNTRGYTPKSEPKAKPPMECGAPSLRLYVPTHPRNTRPPLPSRRSPKSIETILPTAHLNLCALK